MLDVDENNPYEGKWIPAIPDEKNEILQFEYRLAKHLRKILHLDDQPERLNPEASKEDAIV